MLDVILNLLGLLESAVTLSAPFVAISCAVLQC